MATGGTDFPTAVVTRLFVRPLEEHRVSVSCQYLLNRSITGHRDTSYTLPAQPGPTRCLLQVQTETGGLSEEAAVVRTLGSAAVVSLCFQQQTVRGTDKVPDC